MLSDNPLGYMTYQKEGTVREPNGIWQFDKWDLDKIRQNHGPLETARKDDKGPPGRSDETEDKPRVSDVLIQRYF